MTQEDKKEFQFLRKLAEAKVWQITQFDSSPQMGELCKETIDIYDKIRERYTCWLNRLDF